MDRFSSLRSQLSLRPYTDVAFSGEDEDVFESICVEDPSLLAKSLPCAALLHDCAPMVATAALTLAEEHSPLKHLPLRSLAGTHVDLPTFPAEKLENLSGLLRHFLSDIYPNTLKHCQYPNSVINEAIDALRHRDCILDPKYCNTF